MKVKVIEAVREVWSEITQQATLEIDGEQFTVRYNESPKHSTIYLLVDGDWQDIDAMEDRTPTIEKLEQMIWEFPLSEFDRQGDVMDIDLDPETII